MRYLFYITKQYTPAVIGPLTRLLSREGRDWAVLCSPEMKSFVEEELRPPKCFLRLDQAIDYVPDFVLTPENRVHHRLPGVKVQLFHGLGVEKKSHFVIRGFFDVYFTSGPYVTRRFLKMQRRKKYFKVFETGWIKIDGILEGEIEGLRQRLNIPSDKNIVLYAPTFSRSMQSASKLSQIIPKIMKDDEYWLFKFHPIMPKELIQPFKEMDPTRALYVTDADITPYLHLADVMISDTSSVVYEFYALNKPVITFRGIKGINRAIDVEDEMELRAALDLLLKEPQRQLDVISEVMGEINPYLDGSIARRTLEALDAIDPGEFPHKRKPKNLMRKRKFEKQTKKLGIDG